MEGVLNNMEADYIEMDGTVIKCKQFGHKCIDCDDKYCCDIINDLDIMEKLEEKRYGRNR